MGEVEDWEIDCHYTMGNGEGQTAQQMHVSILGQFVQRTGRVNSGSAGASRRWSPCGDQFSPGILDGEGRPLAADLKSPT